MPNIEKANQVIGEFQTRCHELYACFVFAADGLSSIENRFRPLLNGKAEQSLFIGNTPPDQGEASSKNQDARRG